MPRMKRLPNNYGGVTKLTGNRRKPYMAWIPQKSVVLGSDSPSVQKSIEELKNIFNGMELDAQLRKDLDGVLTKHSSVGQIKTKRVPIGYFEDYNDALNCLYEHNQTPIDADLKNYTFANVWSVIEKSLIDGLSPITVKTYMKAYRNCAPIHNKKMRTIKTSDIQKIIDELARTSPSTQNPVMIICNAVFKFAISQDIITKNYTEFVKTHSYDKSEKKIFTSEETDKIKSTEWIYKGKKKSKYDGVDMRRAVLILLYTGTRISELLNVRKEDVHLEERYIEVHGTKTVNADRIVPIHKDIIPYMEEITGNYLISDAKGDAIDYTRFRDRLFMPYMESLGMEHTIHEARHTFISVATASGVQGTLLKKIVGHSDANVTDSYTHTIVESLIREIDKIERI